MYFTLSKSIDTASLKVEIHWNTRKKRTSANCSDKLKKKVFKKEAPFGLKHLRAGFPGAGADPAGYFIQSIKMVPTNKL